MLAVGAFDGRIRLVSGAIDGDAPKHAGPLLVVVRPGEDTGAELDALVDGLRREHLMAAVERVDVLLEALEVQQIAQILLDGQGVAEAEQGVAVAGVARIGDAVRPVEQDDANEMNEARSTTNNRCQHPKEN